jgi:hypothetical protein
MKERLLYLTKLLLTVTSCGQEVDEQEVEEDIATKERIGQIAKKVLEDSIAIPFSLDTLTNYTWEEAFIITPYTQLDKVNHITRADLTQIEETRIEFDDRKNVVAFINNGKLISYVDLPRGSGDFSYLKDSVLLYPFGAAEFRMVNKDGLTPYLSLYKPLGASIKDLALMIAVLGFLY